MTVVARDDRRAVEVVGADRASFLEATLSQRIDDLPVGAWRGALWLDAQGRPLAVLDLARPDEDRLVAVVPADQVEVVVEQLGGRTFLSDATFTATDDEVVRVVTDTRGELVDPPAPGVVRRDEDVLLLGTTFGVDLVGAPSELAAWLASRGLPGPDPDLTALHDQEVRLGIPRAAHEVVAPHLPEEVGVLASHVHLAKGCYPGQEAVARMWMLGRPRRQLVVLDLDGRAQPGDETGSGRDRWTLTRVTSTAPDAALAFAPAGTEVGASIAGDGWTGTVRQVVGAQVPQPGADPNVTRRRDR